MQHKVQKKKLQTTKDKGTAGNTRNFKLTKEKVKQKNLTKEKRQKEKSTQKFTKENSS